MKLMDILEDMGGAVTPTDDVGFADDIEKRTSATAEAPEDFKGAGRVSHIGKNGKKAARIASAAKTKAKGANPDSEETISQHGQNTSPLNFRLGR